MTCGADSGVGRAQADMYEAATVVYRPLMRLFERRRDAVKLMNAAKHLQSLYERIEQTVRRLLCAVASLPFPVTKHAFACTSCVCSRLLWLLSVMCVVVCAQNTTKSRFHGQFYLVRFFGAQFGRELNGIVSASLRAFRVLGWE